MKRLLYGVILVGVAAPCALGQEVTIDGQDQLIVDESYTPLPASAQGYFERIKYLNRVRMNSIDIFVKKVEGGELPGFQAGLGVDENGERLVGPCISNCTVYKVIDATLPDGSTSKESMQLSLTEVQVMAGIAPNAADLVNMSYGAAIAQDVMAASIEQSLGQWAPIAEAVFGDISVTTEEIKADLESRAFNETAEVPAGDLDGDGEDDTIELEQEWKAPWFNPFRMAGGASYFYMEGALALGEAELALGNKAREAATRAAAEANMIADARIAGTEVVDGHETVKIEVPAPEDAVPPMEMDLGITFQPTLATVWIRPDKFVIAKQRMDGVARADGEMRDFFIETSLTDYRDVPDSDMFEPYRRVSRMGGMMNDEQLAQMEEARAQLDQFERELAAMPADQRQMVENMMGGQMDTLRSMTADGTFEYVEVVDRYYVNPDLKALFAPAAATYAAPADPGNLLQRIQLDLTTLSYEPGNTDGVLDVMTQVAISQFEAERGMPVSGEPSQAVADALAVEVANL